ncbi:MAG: DUF6882 domain-containing protein [Burkholderiaceae bacterium]
MNRRSLLACVLSTPVASLASEPSWPELVRTSVAQARKCNGELEAAYRLSEYARWDFIGETDRLAFSSPGKPGPVFTAQYAGAVSSGTWLWSWANPHIPDRFSREVGRVREYGARRKFRKLTREEWPARQADGWEMAAVTNYLLQGKGVYRPPNPNGWSFIVFTAAH